MFDVCSTCLVFCVSTGLLYPHRMHNGTARLLTFAAVARLYCHSNEVGPYVVSQQVLTYPTTYYNHAKTHRLEAIRTSCRLPPAYQSIFPNLRVFSLMSIISIREHSLYIILDRLSHPVHVASGDYLELLRAIDGVWQLLIGAIVR